MPVYVSGVCRFCGCTAEKPCAIDVDGEIQPCSWMDRDHTLCSNFLCVGAIPMRELLDSCFPRLPATEPARAAAAGRR